MTFINENKVIIINNIYPGSSTHAKVVFMEVLHLTELESGHVRQSNYGKQKNLKCKTIVTERTMRPQ